MRQLKWRRYWRTCSRLYEHDVRKLPTGETIRLKPTRRRGGLCLFQPKVGVLVFREYTNEKQETSMVGYVYFIGRERENADSPEAVYEALAVHAFHGHDLWEMLDEAKLKREEPKKKSDEFFSLPDMFK